MRTERSALLNAVIVFLLAASSISAAQIFSHFQQKLTTREFIEQTNSLIRQVRTFADAPAAAKNLGENLPGRIIVTDGSQEYSISYSWLKKDLSELPQASVAKRSQLLKQIQDRLQQTEDQAKNFAALAPLSLNASEKLTAILARREFRDVHGPTALENLRDRFLLWLSQLLGRMFIGAGSHSQVFQIAGYILMAAAVIALAIWIRKRFYASIALALEKEIIPFAPSARNWRSWLNQARQSATQGDWRNGIHLAYWAAISFLEESGAWRPDRARTPREYLKLIGRQHRYFSILRELTQTFELTWYGNQEANATHFQETLGQLEKLGCR